MSKPLSLLAEKLLEFCREWKLAENHVILNGPFLHSFCRSLNPSEKANVQNVLNELTSADIFRLYQGQYFLTRLGEEVLYQ